MSTMLLALASGIKGLLPHLISQMGSTFYLVLFLLIFCETGLVFMPFLPGDSILFLCGSFAASSNCHLNILILLILLVIAAVLGDNINFAIGKKFGKHILKYQKWRKLINPKYIRKANEFFRKYGTLAIFTGRFIPIIRTVIPFTAGISKMEIQKFRIFNLLGGMVWVTVTLVGGYLFGNIPFIRNHIEMLMLIIVLVSLFPAIVTFIKTKKEGS